MNKNEIIKLRVMQVEDRDVPAKYIEAFNSYLDKVVIPHFEKQLAEKDKEIERLRDIIKDFYERNQKLIQDAIDRELHGTVDEKMLRHQICEEFREQYYKKQEILPPFEFVSPIEVDRILDQIENNEKGEKE